MLAILVSSMTGPLALLVFSLMTGCDASPTSGTDLRSTPLDAAADGQAVTGDMATWADGGGCRDPLDPACTDCLPMMNTGMDRVQACQQDPKCVAAQMDLVCCLASAAQDVPKRQHCLQLFSPVSAATFNLFYTYNEECGLACKMH